MGTHAAIVGRFKGKVHFILHLQYDGFLANAGKKLVEFLIANPASHHNVETIYARIVAFFAADDARVYLEDPNGEWYQQEYTYTIDCASEKFSVTFEYDEIKFEGTPSECLKKMDELIAAAEEEDEEPVDRTGKRQRDEDWKESWRIGKTKTI